MLYGVVRPPNVLLKLTDPEPIPKYPPNVPRSDKLEPVVLEYPRLTLPNEIADPVAGRIAILFASSSQWISVKSSLQAPVVPRSLLVVL